MTKKKSRSSNVPIIIEVKYITEGAEITFDNESETLSISSGGGFVGGLNVWDIVKALEMQGLI
jgi:hypothetical protein